MDLSVRPVPQPAVHMCCCSVGHVSCCSVGMVRLCRPTVLSIGVNVHVLSMLARLEHVSSRDCAWDLDRM
jgi:hypothetical protein